MPLPTGIATTTITFGTAVMMISQRDLTMMVKFTPTTSLVWAATGTVLIADAAGVVADAGAEGSVDLINPDQPGFTDGSGNTIRNWGYKVDASYSDGSTVLFTAPTKYITWTAADAGPLDLDQMVPVTASSGITVSMPIVTSVNGQTGAVVVAAGTGTVSDATTAAKGVIRLAGDLAGSASAPTVPALATLAPKVSPQFSGLFGVGDTATTGIPFTVVNTITAAAAIAAGSANIVGTQFNSIFSGDYTAMTGDDPGYLFGGDHMTHVFGVAGVNQVHGFIGEVAIDAPAGTTIPVVIGLESGVCFWGATAGATVAQAISMHIATPTKRLHGATAGTATDAYGIKIDAVTGAAGANFSLFIEEGATSRVGGTLQSNRVEGYGTSLFLGGTGANGASVTFSGATATSGYAIVSIPGNSDGTRFAVQNGSSQTSFFVTAGGKVGFPNAFVRTGVGATGTATALPANPLGYFAVELNGSTVNIPYYTFG